MTSERKPDHLETSEITEKTVFTGRMGGTTLISNRPKLPDPPESPYRGDNKLKLLPSSPPPCERSSP
jgi:hypothetical protein